LFYFEEAVTAMYGKDVGTIHIPPSEVQVVPMNTDNSTGDNLYLEEKLRQLDSAHQNKLLSDKEFNAAKNTLLETFTKGGMGTPGGAPSAPLYVPEMDRLEPTADTVVPTNNFRGKQSYARILCPIGGHRAYHHPMGMCCYTDDRSNGSENVCLPLIFMPFTLILYTATLCYQPCGCICGGRFPWFGDCPCSEQRVTNKFEREHPNKISRTKNALVLTTKGSPNQCIIARSAELHAGQAVPFVLLSHSGMVISKEYTREKSAGPWRYIESNCIEGGQEDAITVRYEEGEFLKLGACDLVLSVAFWKMEVGNVVNFVGGSGDSGHRTKLPGGGRSWTINNDGTISSQHHPRLVLGV
jgi:hypothetical protein